MPNRFVVALAAIAVSGPLWAQAELLSETTWNVRDPRFGGMSALEVTEDGGAFVALSDRAAVAHGTLVRTDGIISGIALETLEDLPLIQPPRESRNLGDAEGLAGEVGGRLHISFESVHRVDVYDGFDGTPRSLPAAPQFRTFPVNDGAEALAIDPTGAVFVIPEKLRRRRTSFPVLRHRDGTWDRPFRIIATEGLAPVGADFGPDGALYLLERSFHGIFGFASRVRRFAPDATGEVFGEVILHTDPGVHDNLEGLAVWRDGDGALRLTMISDDNFNFVQRTQIVEYRLTP
ncbi:MAG: esterase-like activity of phytase family protein [Pseudomonadota bacterium]